MAEIIELSRKSRLKTAISPAGVVVTQIETSLNPAGNLEVAFFSQKRNSRANVLEIVAEDLSKFRQALTGRKK